MSKVVYRKSGRRAGVPLLAASALLLLGLTIANLVWPKRDMIELENRKAAQFPAFSVEALLDGRWQSGFARWMQDQFLLRDTWINTQRAADEIVFQKAEEGGILLAGAFGVLGVACAALVILAMACGSEPFGYDYLYPLMPLTRTTWRDGFVRSIWSRLAGAGEVIGRHET